MAEAFEVELRLSIQAADGRETEVVDLAAMLGTVEDMLQHRRQGVTLTLHVKLGEKTALVKDPSQIHALLANLPRRP